MKRRQVSGWCVRRLVQLIGMTCLLGALSGCGGPPVARDLVLEPSSNDNAPMAAMITFATDKPARSTLAIDDGDEVTTVTPSDELTTEHELLVLGLLPKRSHTLTVTIVDARGRESVLEPLELTTPDVPADLPRITVPARRPHLMEPGITLLNVFRWTDEPGKEDDNWGAVYGVDAEGRLRWWYTADYGIGEMRRSRTGNLFATVNGFAALHEIDMLGNVVAAWHTRLAQGGGARRRFDPGRYGHLPSRRDRAAERQLPGAVDRSSLVRRLAE